MSKGTESAFDQSALALATSSTFDQSALPLGALKPFRLFDMHCHCAFAPNAGQLVTDLAHAGVFACTGTVTPQDYLKACHALALFHPQVGNLAIGLGCHPWWVGEDSPNSQLTVEFSSLAPQARVISEVGLDFSGRHADTRHAQEQVFSLVCQVLAQERQAGRGKLVFLHMVKSSSALLGHLRRSGAVVSDAAAPCKSGRFANWFVVHGFSGSRELAAELVRAGVYLSIGPRGLKSRKTREAIAVVPTDRLLIETDAPAAQGQVLQAEAQIGVLDTVVRECAQIRGVSQEEFAQVVGENSRRLLVDAGVLPGSCC